MSNTRTSAIIWSINNCPYCQYAKELLSQKGIRFEERNIHEKPWSKEHLLESVPNAKSVPQIFLYDKYVGGYTDLLEYFENHGMYTNE